MLNYHLLRFVAKFLIFDDKICSEMIFVRIFKAINTLSANSAVQANYHS
jgi:hypothetical protein